MLAWPASTQSEVQLHWVPHLEILTRKWFTVASTDWSYYAGHIVVTKWLPSLQHHVSVQAGRGQGRDRQLYLSVYQENQTLPSCRSLVRTRPHDSMDGREVVSMSISPRADPINKIKIQ